MKTTILKNDGTIVHSVEEPDDIPRSRQLALAALDADRHHVNITDTDLSFASFKGLGRDTQSINFERCNLEHADFSNCYVKWLRGANLDGAVFTDANLSFGDIRDTSFNATDFRGATMEHTRGKSRLSFTQRELLREGRGLGRQ